MSKPFAKISDERSRGQLLHEIEELRAQVGAERQRCSALAQELTRIKSIQEQHPISEFEAMAQSLARAEEAERVLHVLMELIPYGITIADAPDVRIRQVSRYGLSLTGKSKEELEGIPANQHAQKWGIYLPDGKTLAENDHLPLTRATQKGEVVKDEEFALVSPNGRRIPIHCNAGPIRDDAGQIIGGVIAWRDITERKKIEDALRESEERFRMMANSLPLMVWVHDAEGRQQFVDRTFEKFFGVTREEMKQERWQTLLHPDDAEAYTSEFLACVRERRSFHAEARVRRKDGQWRWIASWANPRWSASGECLGFVGSSADITERKCVEEALRESEERFRAFVTASSEVLFRMSPDWSELRQLHSRGRRDETEVPSRNWMQQYIHKDDQPLVTAVINEAIRTKRACELEHRFRQGDGSMGWMFSRAVPLVDAEGEIVEWFGAGSDITERKKGEEALRKSEQRYRSLFHSMEAFALMEPVWDTNGYPSDFRYLEINAAGARIRGMTPEAIQGRTILEVLPDIDRYWIEAYAQVVVTEKPAKFDRRNHLNGLWYRTYAYCPEKGRVASLIIDITGRKQAELALQELTRSLEQMVAERTELAEARAKQLQALAFELIEAEEGERRRIAQFLHEDLQQILASARFQLQGVRRSMPFEPMLSNVEQLLEESIGKSRSLSHDLSPTVLHHSDMVSALKWLARRKGERYGLNVALETGAEQQLVDTPIKIFLFRAVQELLFNVVKHAGVKSARVVLSGTESSIMVTVSDQGRGFDPAILDSASVKGGLGLLSLRERASYIGGSLDIASTPGLGSRLTLTVPLDLPRIG